MDTSLIAALERGGYAMLREGDDRHATKLLARALVERMAQREIIPESLDAWRLDDEARVIAESEAI